MGPASLAYQFFSRVGEQPLFSAEVTPQTNGGLGGWFQSFLSFMNSSYRSSSPDALMGFFFDCHGEQRNCCPLPWSLDLERGHWHRMALAKPNQFVYMLGFQPKSAGTGDEPASLAYQFFSRVGEQPLSSAEVTPQTNGGLGGWSQSFLSFMNSSYRSSSPDALMGFFFDCHGEQRNCCPLPWSLDLERGHWHRMALAKPNQFVYMLGFQPKS